MSKFVFVCAAILLFCIPSLSIEKLDLTPVEVSDTLPPAVPGNAEYSPNDEAPILRNESGVLFRQDRESKSQVIYFSGFNEECDF